MIKSKIERCFRLPVCLACWGQPFLDSIVIKVSYSDQNCIKQLLMHRACHQSSFRFSGTTNVGHELSQLRSTFDGLSRCNLEMFAEAKLAIQLPNTWCSCSTRLSIPRVCRFHSPCICWIPDFIRIIGIFSVPNISSKNHKEPGKSQVDCHLGLFGSVRFFNDFWFTLLESTWLYLIPIWEIVTQIRYENTLFGHTCV